MRVNTIGTIQGVIMLLMSYTLVYKDMHLKNESTFNNFVLKEVLVWLTKLSEDLGADPSDEKVRQFIWDSLQGGVSRGCDLHSLSRPGQGGC